MSLNVPLMQRRDMQWSALHLRSNRSVVTQLDVPPFFGMICRAQGRSQAKVGERLGVLRSPLHLAAPSYPRRSTRTAAARTVHSK
jgi:hypothetical protein